MPPTSTPPILTGKSSASLRDELEQLVVNDLLGPRSGYPWYPPCKIRGSRGRLRPRVTFHHEAGRFDADREAVEALFHACERYYPLC